MTTPTTDTPPEDPPDATSLAQWMRDPEVAAQPEALQRVKAKEARDRAMREGGPFPGEAA